MNFTTVSNHIFKVSQNNFKSFHRQSSNLNTISFKLAIKQQKQAVHYSFNKHQKYF